MTAATETTAPDPRGKILVVDDDPTVLSTYTRMLRLDGYDVHAAVDAETGLQEAFTYRPDAIFLDLRMPLADGLAFLRRLRAHEQAGTIPVAIVTGDYLIDDSVSDALRELGATIHFKPLWIDDLIQLARQLLSE